jgi:hypothetical protein
LTKWNVHFTFELSNNLKMKKLPLLPHFCQRTGWVLLLPFLALGIANVFLGFEIPWLGYGRANDPRLVDFNTHNFTDELAAIGCILSLMLIAFSKERTEDEAIQFFRLASLQWAVILNYLVLIGCIVLVYGSGFLSVMMYNMFTILIIFIIRFRFVLFQHNKMSA